ncbi:MAG: phosphoribosylglycinamide formyltransferase [Gammaproteobacteria bacterium]|nr:phosphoribosylglycinamide formyltransferase [Gammaproteobacteria bacterium]MDH5734587.1 phosphoribosylglycinamide formyltransferase [Gammaproteobacteria bacterium]
MSNPALPIVVLISGSGSNLQAIIDAIAAKRLHAEVRAVISNRADAPGLQRAQKAGITTHVLNHKDYPDRESFDQALIQIIDNYHPALVVLAGFMRILTDNFVAHYQDRMLNIHPSLLPDFRGLNTHQRVLEAGQDKHGVSVHFVTSELDSGPLVIQAIINVDSTDTAESLANKIHQQEHIIYPMTIQWLAEQRLQCKNNQLFFDDQALASPLIWENNTLLNQNT